MEFIQTIKAKFGLGSQRPKTDWLENVNALPRIPSPIAVSPHGNSAVRPQFRLQERPIMSPSIDAKDFAPSLTPSFALQEPLHAKKARVAVSKNILLHELRGQEFEQFCLDLLQSWGFLGRLTKTSGDNGIDIFAKKHLTDSRDVFVSTLSVACQCKGYVENSYVGEPMLRDFCGSLVLAGIYNGYFFTSSRFSEEARTFCDGVRSKGISIELFDRERLLALQNSLV